MTDRESLLELLAIDADLIDPASLLTKANRSPDRQLWLVRAGERLLLQARQMIRLSQDEVLFFETSVSAEPILALLAA